MDRFYSVSSRTNFSLKKKTGSVKPENSHEDETDQVETECQDFQWMEIQQQKYREQLDKKLDVRSFFSGLSFLG
jgi:hypothetical protein